MEEEIITYFKSVILQDFLYLTSINKFWLNKIFSPKYIIFTSQNKRFKIYEFLVTYTDFFKLVICLFSYSAHIICVCVCVCIYIYTYKNIQGKFYFLKSGLIHL